MAGTGKEQVVATPPILPPRVSFLNVVPEVQDEARWELPGGIQFKPQRYGTGWRDRIDCTGTHDAHVPTALVNTDFIDAGMFVVAADEKLSTYGSIGSEDERRQRVLDQLKAIESYEVANEFWTGGNIDAGDSDQRILRSVAADTLTTAAVAPELALGIVEQGLGQLGKGQRGMVHVTMQTLTALVAASAVHREGNAYLTASDNWVVADAGYPGTGPLGHARTSTSAWMYGTSMVRVRLGPYIQQGTDGDGFDTGWLTVDTNDVFLRAMRPVLIQWDEQVHVAAETNLTLALVAGAS